MRAQDGAAELPDIRYNEANKEMWEHAEGVRGRGKYLVPSSVQLMNWEDFGSLIILRTYVTQVSK